MAHSAVGRLLRCQNPSTLRQSIGSLTQKRNWSAKAIPRLTPTSSPDLDQALNRFREELFIPHWLSEEQRRLIYRPKFAQRLEEQPVTVNLGPDEEPYRLRSFDPRKLPSNKDAKDVLSLMHQNKNWQNLVQFLTGLRRSHRTITPDRWEWLVRKAGESNGLGVLLECAKRSEETGFELKSIPLVQRLFFELHRMAADAEFKGPALEKALGLAKQFTELMETPEHIVRDVKEDPKRQPFVIGTLLELSAARAVNELGGKDENGEVRAYARRLIASWPFREVAKESGDRLAAELALQENVPIWNGMRLAVQLDEINKDKTLSSVLKQRANEVGMLISGLKKSVAAKEGSQPPLGLAHAQQLLQD